MESLNFKIDGWRGHQGDVQIFSLDSVPENAKPVQKQFIAKSEKSGHAHAMCGDYEMFEVEAGHIIKVGSDGATLNHTGIQNLTAEYWDRNEALPVADHKATSIPEGIYFVGIQRKADPFAGVFKQMVD